MRKAFSLNNLWEPVAEDEMRERKEIEKEEEEYE